MAAYLMGLVLECVLKAASCKSLKLSIYPEPGTAYKHETAVHFRTHNFEQLLVVSGLSDIFGILGVGSSSWSEFIQEYQGKNYTDIRYDAVPTFNKNKVMRMRKYLTDKPHGIITLVKSKKRW
jgi:hypothetical protein